MAWVGGSLQVATLLGALALAEVMAGLGVPGMSVAVIRDFRIHWTRAYGVSDVATGRPVDGDVNAVLRSWRVPRTERTGDEPVTPRSLLSHTSGADDGFGFPGYEPGAPLPNVVQIPEGARPSNVGAVRFARAPYAAFKYSGGGLTVMQLALTELAGIPFAELMLSSVLRPLGMTRSTYVQPLPDTLEGHAARAHDGRGRRMGPPWHVYAAQAAAGLWTTPTWRASSSRSSGPCGAQSGRSWTGTRPGR